MEWEVTTDWTIVLGILFLNSLHDISLILLKVLFALATKMKDNFHEYLNKQNADIQFTKEIEENSI